MASPTPPTSPVPAGDNQPAIVVDAAPIVPFDEKLRLFWVRNRKGITAFCFIVLIAIIGKGGWEAYQANRENGIAAEYAKATTPEQLKAFASANEGHALAGVAHLRVADEAYTAGKYSDAVPHYAKAVTALKSNPLAPRAVIGGAVSKLLSGDRAGGETALKAISADLSQPASVRAEATYHLASLASESGDDAALQLLLSQLTTISPQSFWSQRAGYLRAKVATSAAPAPAPGAAQPAPAASAETPAVKFPGTGK